MKQRHIMDESEFIDDDEVLTWKDYVNNMDAIIILTPSLLAKRKWQQL